MALVKYNNNSISAVTSAASIPSGALVPIKTLTASSSSTLSFVHGSSDVVLDGTYPIYLFKFINCHPATDSANFTFNMSADTGSNYNVTKTTTYFDAVHSEGGSDASVSYSGSRDLAQSTAFQILARECGNGNDESSSGELYLFNPSSTTFVKHFISKSQFYYQGNYTMNGFIAGYGNTTSAVDAVQFKFSSGNIDAGTIKLYGIKDS
ncbi:hypothetical protein [uncultured Mediterranean phage uvMED]|nr:hypothetical protein [uncultured Mediterranean phage uvMED]